MFKTDYSQINSDIPDGTYEMIIKYAGEDVTRGGTEYINITLVVRNDIDQAQKNRYFYHSIWHKKAPTPADLACGGYSFKQIQALSKAAGLPNGKEYENLQAWCDDLQNKCVKVVVEHEEYPEGSGTMHARARWIRVTEHPECSHQWEKESEEAKPKAPDNKNFEEVATSEEDLPF